MTQEIVLTDLRDLADVIDRFPVDDRVPESMALVPVVNGPSDPEAIETLDATARDVLGSFLALPDADLWFWDVADTVHEVASQKLLEHARPFEDEFKPANRGLPLEAALDKAKSEDRVLVLGLHGGRAENGELQAMCELRGVPFTGSGSASSNLAFDKVAP